VRDLPGGFPGDAYPLRANPSFADLVRATSDVPSPGGRGPEAFHVEAHQCALAK